MYSVPASQSKSYYNIENFLGVDFTTSPLEVDKRRSPNAKNIINNDGYNETRFGYECVKQLNDPINGIWNIDLENDEVFIVHAGTKLYKIDINFTECLEILDTMNNQRSTGLYLSEYLVIFDGMRAIVYSNTETGFKVSFLDESGYIPTTSVGRDSSGGGTDYELVNLMSPYRINTFLTEEIDEVVNGEIEKRQQTIFKLDDTNIDDVELVEVLTDSGTWDIITDYQVDKITGQVTLASPPGDSPVLGRDNVSIKYKKIVLENSAKINKCSLATLFGYEGNNNRIFVSGNPDFPNYDFHCEQEDPTYWPDENFTKIGTEPIVNYSRLGDGTLAVHKKQSDTDCTIYYRKTNLLNNLEVFPLQDGVKNIGCISKYANCNLLNDPLFLSDQGVFSVIGQTGEKFAQQRSFYVNGKLLKENNLEEAVAVSVLGKYYLAVNNHVYIADSRYMSYPKHAKTEQYQYEWWYWDNIPVRVFFVWNNILFFGTEDGKICKFNNSYIDIDKPIEVYWETPFLELNSSFFSKTIKMLTLVLNPKEGCDIEFGYELDDGSIEIIKKQYKDLMDDFPKTIQEKEKIKKFMFVKFYFKNNTANRMTFERLLIEYILAGKYRGN